MKFLLCLLAFCFLSVANLLQAEEPAPASTATVNTETSKPEVAEDPDGGWPRDISSEAGAKIRLYQPQVETWTDQKNLIAWAAVEVLTANKSASELGVVKWVAKTSVALEERLVRFENIELQQVNFPTLNQAQAKDLTSALKGVFPKTGLVISLDRMLAAVDKSTIRADGVIVNREPPPIFYASRPAKLIQFDGEPIVSPIKDSPLKFIVNTNWDVFQDPDTNKYYLRFEKSWLTSSALETGWVPVKKLPKSFETLPDDPNWAEVKKNIPGKSIRKSEVPFLYVSKQPAELIVTEGKPKKERVGKTKLYWINNTDCDLFQMKKGAYYFVVAGRWFSAEKLEGPWTFATPTLPDEFKSIPRTHPRARVRAAIPGTDEAAEAVLLAQIPRTIKVKKGKVELPEVKYQGEPQFKDIKGTRVKYAVNSTNDVLKVDDTYFLCFQGGWFQSKKSTGPWEATTQVPDEIYKIPPDSPVHHVTYVQVESSDAESVTYSCNAGYSGVTVSFGVAMWGTGWWYPPYSYYGGYYPAYYPYHSSYGGYAIYNSRTGAYGYGTTVGGPYGGLSHAATYNPNTGTYRRGTATWGPNGSEMRGQAYNPRTGASMETRQGRNEQGSWGASNFQRGDDWAKTGHIKNDSGKISGIKTSEGSGMIRKSGEDGSGFVGKKGDDIYAGRDGNVYRKTEDGWQQRTEGGWNDVDGGNRPSQLPAGGNSASQLPADGNRASQRPADSSRDGNRMSSGGSSASTRDQLNRDYGSRSSGNERTRASSSSYNRGSSGMSRGSYGGGGGMSRGGGGGRRR